MNEAAIQNGETKRRAKRDAQPALLVTSAEAAAMLSISERTLWSLSAGGEIVPVYIGAAKRYRVSDLEAYCARLVETSGR